MITAAEYDTLLKQAHALRAALEESTRSDLHAFWARKLAASALAKCGELPALPPGAAALLQTLR